MITIQKIFQGAELVEAYNIINRMMVLRQAVEDYETLKKELTEKIKARCEEMIESEEMDAKENIEFVDAFGNEIGMLEFKTRRNTDLRQGMSDKEIKELLRKVRTLTNHKVTRTDINLTELRKALRALKMSHAEIDEICEKFYKKGESTEYTTLSLVDWC